MGMRIKFRAWDGKRFLPAHESVYDWALEAPLGKNGKVVRRFHGENDGREDCIVQQYTGKLDIEGNEICEGDLVEFVLAVQTHPETGERQGPPDSFGVYEVFYRPNWAGFALKAIRLNWMDCWFDKKLESLGAKSRGPCNTEFLAQPLAKFNICRIIGNIFENPELTNGKSAL